MTSDQVFLKFSADKLEQLSGRIQDCLGRLNAEQVWARGSGNENAVGNLVLHLCGNVRQWIGTGVGGEVNVRDRDSEFQARAGASPAELADRLKSTVDQASGIIRNLPASRLSETTVIQKYDVTLLEAIYHVVEHFSQHAGQIMFATKMLTGDDLGYYRHLKNPQHRHATP
jgi:uncharacterized damage-inducible protein DinB